MADKVVVKDYESIFDPLVYLQSFYGGAIEDVMAVLLRKFHEAFMNGDLHGTRLLDIGSGPSICSVISATPHFQEIYLSEYAAQNRAVLTKWLNGSLDFSFQNVFEYFLKLEGKEENWTTRETELRSKVKNILKCDMFHPKILKEEDDIEQFDVITSSLCIEAGADDLECYGQVCKKIGALLKHGGHVVLIGVLDQTYYVVGDHHFYTLCISKGDVIKSWENAGFSVVNWSEEKNPDIENYLYSDFSAAFVLVAKKDR